jgi:hypothetical protein
VRKQSTAISCSGMWTVVDFNRGLQVRVRRTSHGEPEVDVQPESMSASPSRQLVAEMMIMAGEVIGDLGRCLM